MTTRSRATLALVGLATALLACGCVGGHNHGKGTPPTCNPGCPSGYTCSNGVCEGGSITKVDWDIHTVTVSGRITANGVPPTGTPKQGCIIGQVWLTFKSAGGASFSTYVPCGTTDGAFTARVTPGTYRVLAEADAGTSFPAAGKFLVTPKLVITGDVSAIDWNVQTVPVSGHITADGAAPTSTGPAGTNFPTAAVTFEDDNGAVFETTVSPSTTDGAFSLNMQPGTYRVIASGGRHSTFPEGTFLAAPKVVITGATSGLDWNLRTVSISGHITANGAAPKLSDPSQCGASVGGYPVTSVVQLTFVAAGGATFRTNVPCDSTDGAFTTRVAPGTYQVLATGVASTTFPAGTFLATPKVVVTADVSGLSWNVQTVPVSGVLTVNGAPPTLTKPDPSCNGQVQIRFDAASGAYFEGFVPCGSADGAFTLGIQPGTYHVSAFPQDTFSSFPVGTFVVAPKLQITHRISGLSWNVQTVTISGHITADGVAPRPSDPSKCFGDQMFLVFTSDTGASFSGYVPCTATDGGFTTQVTPGTYHVTAFKQELTLNFPAGIVDVVDALKIP